MGDTPTVLSLDLATNVGFAVYAPGAGIRSGTWRVAPPATGIGVFLHRFDEQLTERLRLFAPTYVIFEAPWVGPQTHQDTARKLLGLAGETERVCHREGLAERNVYEANNAAVRKHFCGKGRGPRAEMKDRVIRACRERGWAPESDDEADALAVLDYAIHWLRLPVSLPVGGLFGDAA